MTPTAPLRSGAARGFAQVIVLWIATLSPLAAQDGSSIPHVRASAPRIKEALSTGIDRSSTFRSLVETIDRSDGLVMVEEGVCRFGVRACLRPDVVVAGQYRLLFILVVSDRAPGCQLVEAIGHELYHAFEVLREPGVRSFPDLFSLFQRLGAAKSGRFETTAAVNAGLMISREACR